MSFQISVRLGGHEQQFRGTDIHKINEQVNKFMVEETLKLTQPKGNRLQAARMLGINRNTLAKIAGKNKWRK